MSSTTNVDYSTLEAQEGFLALPTEDQQVLLAHHQSLTKALNWPKTIEIAGKRILAMPLETMGLTPEQSERFKTEVGGFEVDCSKMTQEEQIQFAKDNPEAPIDWQVSFENRQAEIDRTLYKGFDLFKKVYEAFPDIHSLTKEEATERGIYPIIHYRNLAARKWIAEMNGGHLATLNKNHYGELSKIWDTTEWRTNLEKLAAMGQAPLGWRDSDTEVYGLGGYIALGSGSSLIYDDSRVRGLGAHCYENGLNHNHLYWQEIAVSCVVVLDK